ncbi:MAG: P-loop NTPase fold protein, partial [Solirubrobacteraceae bacterium]|nr:P-loop NTPase fold protein [Solirubrobacteraceae bacterium]
GADDDLRPRVFLSYTRDRASDSVRQPLVKALDAAGFEPWRGVPPALEPGPARDSFVAESRAAVVIVSPMAHSSEWMQAEERLLLRRAAEDPAFVVVAIRTSDVPPAMFERWDQHRSANVVVIADAGNADAQIAGVLDALAPLRAHRADTSAAGDSTLLTAADHVGGVSAVAWARLDGRPCVVTGDGVGTLRVIDVVRDELRFQHPGLHAGFISELEVGMLGGVPTAVSGGYDGNLCLVDLVDITIGTYRRFAPGGLGGMALAGSRAGLVAICALDDGTLEKWDSGEPERRAAFRASHEGAVRAIAVTDVGGRSVAVSGGEDRRVRLWDVDTGEPIDEPRRGHTGAVQVVATTVLDSRPVAVSGGAEGTLRVWDLADGGPGGEPLQAHEGGVLAIAATAAGVVVSAGQDGAVRVWDLRTRQQLAQRLHTDGETVGALAIGNAGGREVVVMGGADGGVRLWDLPAGSVGAPAAASPAADASGAHDRVDWVSDARAKADLLQRRPLAQTLATRLNRLRAEEPGTSFLVHLDGRWGAGKSTVLDLLRDELAEDWLVVEFDAWRQMRVGPPWWALLASLRHAIRDDLRWDSALRLRVREALHRGRRGGPLYAVALIALLGLVLLLGFGVDLGGIDRTVSSILVVLGGLGTLIAGASALGRFLLWDSVAGAKVFEQSQRDPMDSVAEHFGWLVARAGKPVVFFVDDLDRCSNEYVVALLDAVQTLVRDAPARRARRRRAPAQDAPTPVCHVVVAADGRWIRTSYEQEHAHFADAVAEPGRALGYLFLAKIFQLTVEVPAISPHRQDAFMRGLLRSAGGDAGRDDAREIATKAAVVEQQVQDSTSEAETLAAYDHAEAPVRAAVAEKVVAKLAEKQIERSTEHALERFAPLLEANPRAMKLFVNAYGVARALQILEDNVVPRDPLALWTIVRTRWPGLAEYVRGHPEAIEALAAGGPGPPATPKDIEALFGAPAVRRVITCAHGGPLTPALIRACCGLPEDEELPPAV